MRALLSRVVEFSELAPWREASENEACLASFEAGGAVVEIRRAEPRDAEALVELTRAVESEEQGWLVGGPEWRTVRAARRYVRDARGRRDRAVIVADHAGEVVGRLSLLRGRHAATAHVTTLAVLVSHERRGQGIGRALMDAAEAWAREVGVSKIELAVFAHNSPAITLYERLGYRREGVRLRHLRHRGDFLDVLLMGKEVASATGDDPAVTRAGSAPRAHES